MNHTHKIQAYFDSSDQEWEQKYEGGGMEAAIYEDRQHASMRLIKSHVPRGGRVLELGCGTGILGALLSDAGFDVVASDFSLRMLGKARRRIGNDKVVAADVNHLPFMPGTFDAVVLIGVVAYLEDLPGALSGVADVLKPGGVMVVSSANRNMLLNSVSRKLTAPFRRMISKPAVRDPNRQFFRETNRYYTASEFNSQVAETGFELVDRETVGFGRLKFGSATIFPHRFNIFLSRGLSRLARRRVFSKLSDYAFNNIACFRTQTA